MEEELLKENEYLKERVAFLEKIIEVNQETLARANETNTKLLDWLKSNFPQKLNFPPE